jgi:hypothetical protein
LDVGVTALEITEACSLGRQEVCTKAKYVEGGKLVFGVAGAAGIGHIGASAAVGGCAVVFGIPTGGLGALACMIVGGAVGGLAGGAIGNRFGENVGVRLYESAGN